MSIDFTNCELDKFKVYGGANGSKRGILYNGESYMLKFPAETKINKGISYSNSTVSEYIGCHIYNLLGIPVKKRCWAFTSIKEKQRRLLPART